MTTQVTTALLADSALTSPKIADNAIVTAKIADAQVTSAKLAAGVNAGRWVAGTTLTLDPIALNTRTTTAHGLGTTPVFAALFLECKTAELGYSPGDRVSLSSSVLAFSGTTYGIQVRFDATNTVLEITNNSLPAISHKTNTPPAGATAITAANWIVRVIPYALTT
jgi:hypothetical protein